ncbi:sulfite oxidase [Roseomonas sp. SSH11]|uniref:Sulfite oxidase n=1 Tax=Pararoseomonas baculiformis TaxID=2820812 RepID=A0ABS4AA97_9PROT|nr:sulfite oxidase [Pararoseomonas baculiformis]MBP0443438.1 sulfite oxidase [Pararoseomonas baculiformis]
MQPHPATPQTLREIRRQLPEPALNLEPPVEALRAEITPVGVFFVRNNGTLPDVAESEGPGWTLSVEGLVSRPFRISLAELRERFEVVELVSVLECAGNGRASIAPAVDGLPWGPGAVGCARWTGFRLADLLAAAGADSGAVYLGFEGADHAIGKPGVQALSRGLPMAKALAPETLLAFAMNGAPLAREHGFPLRVVAPGFPGSAWQKWLTRILVLDREHDGAKMTGLDYRMPRHPLSPGDPLDPAAFEVITDMPVKSLVTEPSAGFQATGPLSVAGFAWSGHVPVAMVEVSADGGSSWHPAQLEAGEGPWAWRRFRAGGLTPPPGPVELLARATDRQGRAQPLLPAWNPRGYLNNAVHRVAGTLLPGGA